MINKTKKTPRKPITTHNGLKVYSTLKTKTPLKTTTHLKAKSDKQKQRDYLWQRIKVNRIVFLTEKYGAAIREYCGRAVFASDLGMLDGHHIDTNRRNNTPENCYICHRICHSYIHDHNLIVKQEDFQGK